MRPEAKLLTKGNLILRSHIMKKVLLEITRSCSYVCLALAFMAPPLAQADESDPGAEAEAIEEGSAEDGDSSTSLRYGYGRRGFGGGSVGYRDPCYYDYTTHYNGATYPYILGNPYSDDYSHNPYKHYPEYDCYAYTSKGKGW